jgi:hypothetical protein
MENMNWIEQKINQKKRYIEIQEKNITRHNSYIENYKLGIEKIDKCKNLKDLRDYNKIYAYNWEKYICYEIWEWSIDNIYEFDNFDDLKDFAKRYYLTLIERSNNEIKQSNELIDKIKADIDKLKTILQNMVNSI